MKRRHSQKLELVQKARESMLSSVQAFNNPLATFRTETFIVLSNIAWTYLAHSYFKQKKIDYRYIDERTSKGQRKHVRNKDGNYKSTYKDDLCLFITIDIYLKASYNIGIIIEHI